MNDTLIVIFDEDDTYFDDEVISKLYRSTKPNSNNFQYFDIVLGSDSHYVYHIENTSKIFLGSNINSLSGNINEPSNSLYVLIR